MKTKLLLLGIFFNIAICTFSQTIDTVCPYRYQNTIGLGLNPQKFVVYNGYLYFIGNYKLDGKQYLWKSDGSWAGSSRVKEINPGNPNDRYTSVSSVTVVNNLIYISDRFEGNLWRSDGTTDGTFILKKSIQPLTIAELNSLTYFFIRNSSNYYELWQTDGSISGTNLIKTLDGPLSLFDNSLFNLFKYKNKLIFDGIDKTNGKQLWETDGTSNGTKILRQLAPPNICKTIANFTISNNILYFLADDSSGNLKLWRSDGTDKGTYKFTNKIGTTSYNFLTVNLINFKNKLYLKASDPQLGTSLAQLFVTDGTDTGTHPFASRVFKFNGRDESFNPSGFTIMNNELYMTGCSPIYGYQIWKTDGTINGTLRVTSNDSVKGFPSIVATLDNHIIYLAGISSPYLPELHYSNGNVDDFHHQKAYDSWRKDAYYASEFINFKGAVYFNSNCTSIDEYELYRFYFDKPSNVNRIEINNNLLLYPNPNSGYFNVKSENPLGKITIYNAIGQEVYSDITDNNEISIFIDKPGIYIVQTINGSTINSKKLIINK